MNNNITFHILGILDNIHDFNKNNNYEYYSYFKNFFQSKIKYDSNNKIMNTFEYIFNKDTSNNSNIKITDVKSVLVCGIEM